MLSYVLQFQRFHLNPVILSQDSVLDQIEDLVHRYLKQHIDLHLYLEFQEDRIFQVEILQSLHSGQ